VEQRHQCWLCAQRIRCPGYLDVPRDSYRRATYLTLPTVEKHEKHPDWPQGDTHLSRPLHPTTGCAMPAATTSGSDAKANGSAKSRDHNQGNQNRNCTPEQKSEVLRVRRCKPTAFYEILNLESVRTTVTDTEIKKAYRKISLLTHPDKNGHEHADEAFKMVSRAFGVLGDPDKRTKYDRYGGDPDSRFGGGAQPQSPFSGFANRGGGQRAPSGAGQPGGSTWEEEISPEEMFNRFFGGGGLGGGFGPFGGECLSLNKLDTTVLICCRRRDVRLRSTVRVQYGRGTWDQSSSIWWWETKKKTSRPKCASGCSRLAPVYSHGDSATATYCHISYHFGPVFRGVGSTSYTFNAIR